MRALSLRAGRHAPRYIDPEAVAEGIPIESWTGPFIQLSLTGCSGPDRSKAMLAYELAEN